MNHFWKLITCTLYFVAYSGLSPVIAEPRIVVSVVDGDTIRVKGRNGATELVRLIGVDAPEIHQSKKMNEQANKAHAQADEIAVLGERAKEFHESLVKRGATINCESEVRPRDKYGRLLAYVYLEDGTLLNDAIVRAGYAQVWTVPPNVGKADQFLSANNEAREARRGLWSFAAFTAQNQKTRPQYQKKYNSNETEYRLSKYEKNVLSGQRKILNLPAGKPW